VPSPDPGRRAAEETERRKADHLRLAASAGAEGPSGPGWADSKGEWKSHNAPTLPLPREWGRFKGMYLHGKRVVLASRAE